jgi:hypothetical protein
MDKWLDIWAAIDLAPKFYPYLSALEWFVARLRHQKDID